MRKLNAVQVLTEYQKSNLLDDTTRELLGSATLDPETQQVRYDLNPEGTCYVIEQCHGPLPILTMQSRLATLYRDYAGA